MWVPAPAGTMMARVAVEGSPGTRVAVPWATPSRVNVKVPVGAVAPVAPGATVAVNTSELVAYGVVVAGVTTEVVPLVATVTVTGGDVEAE